MGFETGYDESGNVTTTTIIRQSLWDLKPEPHKDGVPHFHNYKTVPMGFETVPMQTFWGFVDIIRQSLWDLKLGEINAELGIASL